MTLRRTAALACIALLLLLLPASGIDARRPTLPDRLDDATFWRLHVDLSEAGGTFRSENLISNERTFPLVLPDVARRASPASAYVGVGPEQNFSYLAALKPRIAFIVDIRRQNAVLHLLYKALFELAPTRAEFLSRLFSRPRARHLGPTSTPRDLMEAFAVGLPSRDLFEANLVDVRRHLTATHRFALDGADLAGLEHVYEAFFADGPEIRYAMRSFRRGQPFPTLAELMTATDEKGRFGSFLATEASYAAVRTLQQRNLIVPVVGDFAGDKALKQVGAYLRGHGLTVTAFYASNVEMYLLRTEEGRAFYGNLAALPINGQSVLIRSVFPFGWMGPGGGRAGLGGAPAGAPGPGTPGRLHLDPLGDLVGAAQRGDIVTYGDLLARVK